MAISDLLPGVEVTVKVDGQPLREYIDRFEKTVQGVEMCYIEALSGKNFTISVSVASDAKLEGDSISVDILTDGWKADGGVVFKPGVGSRANVWTSIGYRVDDNETRKFKFAAVETVEDGHQFKNEKDALKALGDLEIKISHCKAEKRVGGRASSIMPNSILSLTKTITAEVGEKREQDGSRKAPELGFVSEKAIKGQTISHSISFEPAKPKPKPKPAPKPAPKRAPTPKRAAPPKPPAPAKTTWSYNEIKAAVSFVFKYRSIAALKSLRLITPTPEPVPLLERDIATLTMEEMRERLRLQEMRSQEQTATIQRIKRERTDDNETPPARKVARPAAGDTQLEVDENGGFRQVSTKAAGKKKQDIIEID